MKMTMSKHENLQILRNAEVRVPEFIVIDESRIKKFLHHQETYQTLGIDYRKWDDKVSVRSSGSVSTPGRMSTKLNVEINHISLYKAINDVYQSSFDDSVTSYLKNKNITDFTLSIIVQKMIKIDHKKDCSGVLTTIHPVTQEHTLYGNVIFGMNGDELMSGNVNPHSLGMIEYSDEKGWWSLLCEVAKIKSIFRVPQEIEFVIKDSVAYILQTRDFEQLSIESSSTIDFENIMNTHQLIGQGESATPFDCIGQITTDKSNCKGKILLTEFTDFEDTENLIDCLGIITRTGGTLSHAAIIAREYNKPCIVGARINGQILQDDMIVMHHKGGIFKKN